MELCRGLQSHFTQNSNSFPLSFARIVQFFADFEKPLPKLRETFFTVQNHVGRALLDLWPAYEKGELSYLTNKRPLELLSEPDKIPFPSIDQIYFDLANLEKTTEYILYGYLCCPEGTALSLSGSHQKPANSKEPQAKRGLDLLFKAISSNYVVTIYGDETFMLHEQFDEIFAKFKSSSINLKKESKGYK